MENIKLGYIPVGQVVKLNTKKVKTKEFIKKNKLSLIIGGVSVILLSIYCCLIMNFINLIKIMY